MKPITSYRAETKEAERPVTGEEIAQGRDTLAKMTPKLMRAGWGKDALTRDIEGAMSNTHRVFLTSKAYCKPLATAQEIFYDVIRLTSPVPKDAQTLLAATLFARAFVCFFGATRLSLGGQATEAYVLLRACLENSLYAFYVTTSPQLPTVWEERENSDATRKKCKEVFKVINIWKALENKAPRIAREAKKQYEWCIAEGAHPNVDSVSPNLQAADDGSCITLQALNSNTTFLRSTILMILRTVDIVFKIHALIFPNEFKQANLSIKMANWRRDSKTLVFATSLSPKTAG
jgi:hypothetical protein